MITRRDALIGGASLVGAMTLAGCGLLSTDGEFEFDTVAFTTGLQAYDDYEKQPDRTYQIGETVWVLLAVRNPPIGDDGTASFEYTFSTETPDGSTWDPVREREETWEDVDEDEILIIWEDFPTYEEDDPGEYEMQITVEDQHEGKRLRTDERFTLTE